MIPENLKFGGHGGDPASLATILLMLLAGVLILTVKRKYAVIPYLLGTLLLPYREIILVGNVHLQMLRFLTLFGLIRLLWERFVVRGEKPAIGKLHPIDRVYIYLTFASAVASVLLNPEWASYANRLGVLYDSIGIYFVLRFLISDEEEVTRAFKAMIIVAVMAAVIMSIEQLTHKNIVAYLGGVPLESVIREGRLRAHAFFAHPLIAGAYGAILLPLSLWFWLKGGNCKKYAVLCFLSATVMTVASSSSTPLLAYAAGIAAFGFWPLRRHMRLVRWGTVISLVVLHIIMKGPVWALINHIDLVGGNSAYHRYQLVDQCIRHFGDWWAIGTNDNGDWGFDMWDTCNYYVGTAESYGLIPLILLLAMIGWCFQSIGRARAASENDNHKQLMYWCIGAVLFAQCTAYFGIAYFDQTMVAWYALLTIVVALTKAYMEAPAPVSETVSVPEPEPPSRIPWRAPASTQTSPASLRKRSPFQTP